MPINAATHYIRAGASGTGSDWTNACPGFSGSCAVSSMIRGDTYYVAEGSYGSLSFNRAVSGSTPITIKKATAADHGTAAGWSASYGDGQATFGALDFTSSYWVFDGATGGGPGSWTSGFGFKVSVTAASPALDFNGASNVTVRHIEIQGSSNSGGGGSIAQDGVASAGSSNATLSYYYIHEMGRCPFFLVPAKDFTAEYGYTGNFVSTEAAHSELASIWGGVSGAVTFRYSIFTAIDGTGGLMWDNNNDHNAQLRVYGNVFYKKAGNTWNNSANGLVGGWTGGGGEDCYNVHVINNTFYGTSGLIFTDFITRSGNNEAVNNIFYNSSSPSYSDFTSHNYNHYINSGGNHSEANGTSATSGDPFVNAANLDFRLISSTGAGQVLSSPYNVDMYGTVRGSSGVWDRGAVEMSSGSTSTNPLAPASVTATVR